MDRASLQFLDNLKHNRLGGAAAANEGSLLTIVNINNSFELTAVKYLYSTWCQVAICSISFLSCAFYILTTYNIPEDAIAFALLEIFFFVAFFLDYLFHFIASKGHRIRYLLSFSGVVDFLSLLPIISLLQFKNSDVLLIPKSFLGFLRFLRLLAFLQFLHLKNLSSSSYSQQPFDTHVAIKVNELVYEVSRLVIYITTFLFLATSVIFTYSDYVPYAFANDVFKRGDKTITYNVAERLEWFDSFYFVVVTVSTVSKVISTLLGRSLYLGEFQGSNHVVLCGIIDFELVDRFLTEFFHETHNPPAFRKKNITVVILAPNPPSLQLKTLLEYSIFRNRVRYYVGSSKSQNDLARIRIQDSIAVYVVPDIRTSSLRSEEDSLFLSAVVISKYLHAHSRRRLGREEVPAADYYHSKSRPLILVKLTSSARNKKVLCTQGVDVVLALQEFKYSLLAYGAAYPGFIALFSNLNRAQSYTQRKISQWNLSTEGGQTHWQPKYFHSTRYSVQQIAVTDKIVISHSKILFKNAAYNIWHRSRGKVFVVGVKIRSSKKVLANPRQLCILDCESIFVIASSWTDGLRACYDDSAAGGDDCCATMGDSQPALGTVCERSASSAKVNFSTDSVSGRQQEVKYRHLNSLLTIVRGARAVNGSSEVYRNMTDHTVIIYQTSSPDLTDQSLILPIIHFCNAFRAISDDHIIVLCDRAQELYALAQEVHRATNRDGAGSRRTSIFLNVHFFAGLPRSADNLLACGIRKARSVCLLRPPVASEVSEASIESLNYLRENVVNTDKSTIITMLNLQNLLQNKWTHPFISIEMVHEVNINFIGSSNVAGDTTAADCSESQRARERQWDLAHTDTMFDWELISSGSCFPHTILDAFIVQAIFNPDVLQLWECLLNIGGSHRSTRVASSSSAAEAKSPGFAPADDIEDDIDDKPSFINLSLKDRMSRSDSESLSSSSGRVGMRRSLSEGSIFSDGNGEDGGVCVDGDDDDDDDDDSPLKGKIEKFSIPAYFVGRPFKELYEHNLNVFSILSIAIYRFPNPNPCSSASQPVGGAGDGGNNGGCMPDHVNSQLPFVLVCPDADEMIHTDDEVFVIT